MVELIYRHNFPKFLRFFEASKKHHTREDILSSDLISNSMALLVTYVQLINRLSAHQVGGTNEVSVDVVLDPKFLLFMDHLWWAFGRLGSLGEHAFHSLSLKLPGQSCNCRCPDGSLPFSCIPHRINCS
jgi:hypothetical protein